MDTTPAVELFLQSRDSRLRVDLEHLASAFARAGFTVRTRMHDDDTSSGLGLTWGDIVVVLRDFVEAVSVDAIAALLVDSLRVRASRQATAARPRLTVPILDQDGHLLKEVVIEGGGDDPGMQGDKE